MEEKDECAGNYADLRWDRSLGLHRVRAHAPARFVAWPCRILVPGVGVLDESPAVSLADSVMGVVLQFACALLVLKTAFGRGFFEAVRYGCSN
jgi:hypothetical protein